MQSVPSQGGGPADDLDDAFRRLKETGCSVLVVGDLAEPVQRQVSKRAMGEPGLDRVRVLTTLGRTPSADEWFPDQVSAASDDSHVIELEGFDRSVTTTSTNEDSGRPEFTPDAVERFSTRLGELLDEYPDIEPKKLRVVIAPASHSSLTEELIDEFITAMNSIEGMTYLFLPGKHIWDLETDWANRVDALMDVRTEHLGPPEHRWIILDEILETGWLPV